METYQTKHEAPGVISLVQRLWQRVLSQPAVVLAVMTAILCFAANHLLVVTDLSNRITP